MNDQDLMEVYCGPAVYQITIRGKISKSFLNFWEKMKLVHSTSREKTYSVLTGEVRDQSALSGILNTLTDNRFTIISVIKMDS